MSSSGGAMRTGVAARMPAAAVGDPFGVDSGHAVAHPVDQVHEVLTDGGLRQPVRILEPCHEASVAQRAAGVDDRCRLEEEVEVLRLAIDARVLVDGVRAGHDVRHARRVQGFERTPVDLALLIGDPEIAVRHGLAFFRGEPPGPA